MRQSWPILSAIASSSLATEWIKGKTLDEALALANDSVYGLAASVYTDNLRNAIKLSREIRAGIVAVNCFGEGDASTPFGGYKESGFGGRDNGLHANDQYTEVKTIWIDLNDPTDGDNVA